MLKYIYVFILIIFLFWIKCKLQKNNKIKEEFSSPPPDEKLADMFSSNDGTNHPPAPTFYDKISKLNSNIKYIGDNCVMDATTQLKIFKPATSSTPRSYISLRNMNNDQSLEFSNGTNYKLKFTDERIEFAKIRRSPPGWDEFFEFTYVPNSESINTSVRELRQWHSNTALGTCAGTCAFEYTHNAGKLRSGNFLNLRTLQEAPHGGRGPGQGIFDFQGSVEECKTKCNSYNECGGFARYTRSTVDSDTGWCRMKNNNINTSSEGTASDYDMYYKIRPTS